MTVGVAVRVTAGTTLRFTTADEPFKDVLGEIGDPDEVLGIWGVDGGESTQWKYGIDSEIVKDDPGVYHFAVSTTGMATDGPDLLIVEIVGIGGIDAAVTIAVLVDPIPFVPVP
jgi:hypothetical protein